MRGYYLKDRHEKYKNACRGGVGNKYPDSEDYELEIGNSQNCSTEMMALCIMYDEIIEFLELENGSLAKLLLRKHIELQTEIRGNMIHE